MTWQPGTGPRPTDGALRPWVPPLLIVGLLIGLFGGFLWGAIEADRTAPLLSARGVPPPQVRDLLRAVVLHRMLLSVVLGALVAAVIDSLLLIVKGITRLFRAHQAPARSTERSRKAFGGPTRVTGTADGERPGSGSSRAAGPSIR
jgi:hypothetical protein